MKNKITLFKKHLLAFFTMLMLLSGCSQPKITSSWSSQQTLSPAWEKIVVVALVPAVEKGISQLVESHLSQDLQAMGYNAIPGAEILGPLALGPGQDSAVFNKLRQKELTTVITIALTDKKTESKFVKGHYINAGNFMDYVGPRYALLYEPAHIETTNDYSWETRIYSLPGQDLLYQSKAISHAPPTNRLLAHELGKKVKAHLLRKKIILPLVPSPDE